MDTQVIPDAATCDACQQELLPHLIDVFITRSQTARIAARVSRLFVVCLMTDPILQWLIFRCVLIA